MTPEGLGKMIVSFKKSSEIESQDRKDKAKKLKQSIQASRKVFAQVLTPEFGKTFGFDIDQKVMGEQTLKNIIFRDIAQQPQARRLPLLEIFWQEGFQSWFKDQESLLLVMAVCWYDLIKRFHAGDYIGTTKLEHRQLTMLVQAELGNQLLLRAEKTERDVGFDAAEEEREALRRYRLASSQAFNSLPKVELELGLREPPPKSRRRIKNDAPPPSHSVDFSRSA